MIHDNVYNNISRFHHPATSRHVLSNAATGKPNLHAQAVHPVLDTSGKMTRECGIPGILRVATSMAGAGGGGGGNKSGQGKGGGHNARRKGRNSHLGKDKEHAAPQSPVTRTRLTTEHPDWFEPLLSLPHAKNIVQLYDQLMVLNQRNLILIVSI